MQTPRESLLDDLARVFAEAAVQTIESIADKTPEDPGLLDSADEKYTET